ncbi:type IV pilin [Haloferax mediterranei ATCC 33500]|uniref:Type IV pilin n=1 Tax=Haloferax mediterranei (strain ATCC 33500 / DSM 1411 / JCM 8866 / NBRC 14739 / NCIMB 2177 / R-4) TaxID=523841 RepID=A0A4P8P280_HALMT|nr:archaellin/type IV pilin N-terminal domain-containing protein [Haloferax mediterranei]MDX5988051.1 archaellin/type IV pilin N-terminal domain-containing protein [Haloferax mediterranei ATCC 33500]QCQ74510.1 type IV pilin [Haloferax mediterranei ATCC 33500]
MSRTERGVSPVVATVLLVAIVLVLATTVSGYLFDAADRYTEPQEARAFGETSVVLGPEHRSWNGWNSAGGETRGDIDRIRIAYTHGPVFEGDDIGSVLVRWRGDDGKGGQLRFVNPNRFSDDTDQQYHDGEVGEFCTGDFGAGEQLTIRMVHNRWQTDGETGRDDVGVRYVESNWNDIAASDGPFFRTNGRYPVEYDGDRPMEAGDTVEIRFYGPEDELPIAEIETTAKVSEGSPREVDGDEFDCE